MTQYELEPDYIAAYESAIDQLVQSPRNLQIQHKAVLALARAGAAEFAESEYRRFRLDKVTNNEDIIALGARIAKDLALSASGKDVAVHANRSAGLYKAAYKKTGGYYSGINAVTMTFMGDKNKDRARIGALEIAESLPAPNQLSSEEHYYIEATRAEAFLLSGEREKAEACLREAVQHDPLNFTAHASTLKQFRLIASIDGADPRWLNRFSPPAAAHYCGHIFGHIDGKFYFSPEEEEDLKIKLSDLIQKHDIGFGFGALAAGADIVFAETLLEEGGSIDLFLPVSEQLFCEVSVAPFGSNMKKRFDQCLSKARSVSILSNSENWPNSSINAINGRLAMGQTLMRAKHLSTRAEQIAIFDERASRSFTAQHMEDWQNFSKTPLTIPFLSRFADAPNAQPVPEPELIVLKRSDRENFQIYNSAKEAATDAITVLAEYPTSLKIGIAAGIAANEDRLRRMSNNICNSGFLGVPNCNELFASILTLQARANFQTFYQGRLESEEGGRDRIFTIRSATS